MSTSSQTTRTKGELSHARSCFDSADSILKIVLLLMGMVLLAMGAIHFVFAQGGTSLEQNFNDSMLAQVVIVIVRYLRGAFGALLLVIAGIAAIISAAFGQYRVALGLAIVAVGSFVIISLLLTFFNSPELQSELPKLW